MHQQNSTFVCHVHHVILVVYELTGLNHFCLTLCGVSMCKNLSLEEIPLGSKVLDTILWDQAARAQTSPKVVYACY